MALQVGYAVYPMRPQVVDLERTRRVLAAARGLISAGWVQGCAAKDASGASCNAGRPEAVAFCAESAIIRAARDVAGGSELTGDFYAARWAVQRAITAPLPANIFTIPAWNDVPGRTQEQVVAAFDKALLLLDRIERGGHAVARWKAQYAERVDWSLPTATASTPVVELTMA